MNILQLKYFQTIADEGTIKAASQKLYISQPALSMMLAKLEQELGVELFERVGRKLVINMYGEVVLKYTNRILTDFKNIDLEMKELLNQSKKDISIVTTSSQLISGMLQHFNSLHPNINWCLYSANLNNAVKMLTNGKVDFAITSTPINHELILTRPLLQDGFVLAVPSGHRFSQRTSIHLAEAANERFIALPKDSEFRKLTDDLCRKAGFEPRISMECDHLLRAEYVSSGFGIVITTQKSVMDKRYQGHIAFVNIDTPKCARTICFSVSKEKYMSAYHRAFSDSIVEFYQSHYPELSVKGDS